MSKKAFYSEKKKEGFFFMKNIQRPREKFYYNSESKQVMDKAGNIIGTGRIVNNILAIDFKTSKYERK